MRDAQSVTAFPFGRPSLGSGVSAVRTPRSRAPSWFTLAAVIALHVAAIAWLLQQEPVRQALREAAPVFVNLVTPPEPVLPRTPPPAPKPQPRLEPQQQPIAAPLPLLGTANEPASPARFEAPRAEVAPPPPVEAPRATPAPPTQAAPAREAPPAALPVTSPSFSAAYLNNPEPAYPALSRRMGEQGRVLLRVLVSAHGLAERVELQESSGSQRLDNAALEAVRQWRFIPARQGEKALAAWVLVPILFRLEG